MPILAFFLLLPLIEIALFVLAGSLIGFWPTLLLMLVTSALGVLILKAQKAVTMAELRRAEATFGDPTAPLAGMALRQVAGLLLVLPGFLSDAFALLLLLPPVRKLMLSMLARRFGVMKAGFTTGASATWPPARDVVIDGEAVEIVDATILPPEDRRPPSGWTQQP